MAVVINILNMVRPLTPAVVTMRSLYPHSVLLDILIVTGAGGK